MIRIALIVGLVLLVSACKSESKIETENPDPDPVEQTATLDQEQKKFREWCTQAGGEVNQVYRPHWACPKDGLCGPRLQCKHNGMIAYSK